MVYNGIAYSVKRLAQGTSFSREVFGKAKALTHHDGEQAAVGGWSSNCSKNSFTVTFSTNGAISPYYWAFGGWMERKGCFHDQGREVLRF